MIIILEGVDGSGKTMLAEQMARQTGYAIIHRSQPKSEEEKAEMLETYKDVIRSGKNMIFDRCWYSEMVYGDIMRDASVLSVTEMYELERLVAKKGGVVIHCTGKHQDLWNRAQRRGEDYITSEETFYKLGAAYKDLFGMPHYLPVLSYVYEEV